MLVFTKKVMKKSVDITGPGHLSGVQRFSRQQHNKLKMRHAPVFVDSPY